MLQCLPLPHMDTHVDSTNCSQWVVTKENEGQCAEREGGEKRWDDDASLYMRYRILKNKERQYKQWESNFKN